MQNHAHLPTPVNQLCVFVRATDIYTYIDKHHANNKILYAQNSPIPSPLT